jgi:hypothetical protein
MFKSIFIITGIPGTCQNLVEDDETAVSDVYLIDPDGAINYDNPKGKLIV